MRHYLTLAMSSATTIAWWMGLLTWLAFPAIFFLKCGHSRCGRILYLLLFLGGIVLAWLVRYALLPLETNRPSLILSSTHRSGQAPSAIYIIGTAELQQPFDNIQGLSQYEADTWQNEAFLADFLPFTSMAAKQIYGDKTQINLLHGMFYFEKGSMLQSSQFLDRIWMKSGVLVGVNSLQEANSLARDMTMRFPHPKLGNSVVFKAKALPTNLPIHIANYEFSEVGLQQVSIEVNLDFAMQVMRDLAQLHVTGVEPASSRSLSLILFAKQIDTQTVDQYGISLDRIFFGRI